MARSSSAWRSSPCSKFEALEKEIVSGVRAAGSNSNLNGNPVWKAMSSGRKGGQSPFHILLRMDSVNVPGYLRADRPTLGECSPELAFLDIGPGKSPSRKGIGCACDS